MKPFTVNPAFPHPDSEGDPQQMPLDDAILWAIKTLRDPTADQWTRRKVADELQFSHDTQEPTE